jgi:trk system potassium uptake protein TrkH
MKSKRVAHVLGWILLFLAGGMLLPWLVALLHGGGDVGVLLASAGLTALTGALAVLATRRSRGELTVREGFAVVTLGWVLMAVCGALPFHLGGHTTHWIDAFFESMSGFTTTGASILADPERLPHGIAFWRCFMQWIGGLGIVLFGLAILPMLGVGGLHLFKAETPGPTSEKFTPRLSDTAKILWGIYVGLTALEILLLLAGGMTLYDAAAHSFTTMATGGFSTRTLSLGAWDSPTSIWSSHASCSWRASISSSTSVCCAPAGSASSGRIRNGAAMPASPAPPPLPSPRCWSWPTTGPGPAPSSTVPSRPSPS